MSVSIRGAECLNGSVVTRGPRPTGTIDLHRGAERGVREPEIASRVRLGVDVKVILTAPCVYCMDTESRMKYTG
jgi:hypothetical protein